MPQISETPGEAVTIVPLLAEEIGVTRQVVEGDTVRVATVTRDREHHIDEVVIKERIEVTHVPIGIEVASAPGIRREGNVTIIPVVEETLVITRKLILKEEIHLTHIKDSTRHQETVVLRTQEAVVTRAAPEHGAYGQSINPNQGDEA